MYLLIVVEVRKLLGGSFQPCDEIASVIIKSSLGSQSLLKFKPSKSINVIPCL